MDRHTSRTNHFLLCKKGEVMNLTKRRGAAILLALVIAVLSLSGCGKTDTGKPAESGTPSATASASPSPSEADTTPSDTATPSPVAADKEYYGDWTVSKVLAYGAVGTYSKDDAEKQIGMKLSFTADKASVINDQPSDKATVIEKPDYQEGSLTSGDFLDNFKISFDQLGITAASVNEVIVPGQDAGGCTLLIKDQNTMILAAGGTYFELTRDK
jgi:hypothetical protein